MRMFQDSMENALILEGKNFNILKFTLSLCEYSVFSFFFFVIIIILEASKYCVLPDVWTRQTWVTNFMYILLNVK